MARFKKRNTAKKQKNSSKLTDKSFYFIVEGETEQAYIKALCRNLSIHPSRCNFKLHSKLGNYEKFSTIYRDIRTSHTSKEIFFVYDTENLQSEIDLFNQIKQKHPETNIIISSSCIEVWFLLHFEKLFHNQYKTADERLHELSNLSPTYIKPPNELFITENFIPKISHAINEAKKLHKQALSHNCFYTYTEFHLLISTLEEQNML